MNPAYQHAVFEVEDTLPHSFFIITAYNPKGLSAPMSRNLHQDATLKSVLTQRGLNPVRVTGRDQGNTHREPGWGVQLEIDDALQIANIFKQEAIYEVSEGEIKLVRCKTREILKLGEWASRIVD